MTNEVNITDSASDEFYGNAAAAPVESLIETNYSGNYSEDDIDNTEKSESNPDTDIDNENNHDTPEISIIMVGDILLHTPVAKSGVQEDGSYNFDAVFENVKDEITAVDLAIVNQEVILGGEELGITGYPSFNAPYELGDALVDAGFDVVLHATNHTLDKGGKGVNNCINFWKSNYPDIAVLGINESEEEQDNNIYVYEQDGISVAILNYTYGTNGIPMPKDMPYAVNLLDEEKVTEDIKKAEELADFTIVCPHWGMEYRLTSSAEQERWTDIFLENGADLVIGTHPHVIEPVEWVSDDNGNEMLVYYSLGNFVNWTSGTGEGVANRMVGGMAEVTICKNENGEAYISDYGVEPLVCHLSEGTNGVTTYLLSDYSQQLAAENMIIMQDSEFSLEYCENLCDEVWGELFR
ncbi:MAG: CapA family protein [Lachnospiraceae bacterium]|nr:CapA family protein [Lachnospiraceae bacterium]